MINIFNKRFLIKQLKKYHKSIKNNLNRGFFRTIQSHHRLWHHNHKARREPNLRDIEWKRKYNHRKVKQDEEFYRNLDTPCCDNCINTSIRRSTGVAWCIFRCYPEFDSICDLYVKKTKTASILAHLCPNLYWKWIERQFKK